MSAKIVVVGSSNTDLVVPLPHLPTPGETVLGGSLLSAAGGKGANQAVAAARLGAQVTFVGCIGGDLFGATAREQLQREGVDIGHVRTEPGVSSGVALILVDGQGQNIIAVAPGANLCLTEADVAAAAPALQRAAVLLLQLEVEVAPVLAAARLARQAGVRVILNPAPARSLPPELLALADILTPNEREASLLTGLPPGTHPRQLAEHLQQAGAGTVIVTLGSAGALVKERAREALHIPGFAVQAVDTVAAGDAFNAGLAVALAQGEPLAEAVRYANAVGALSVTRRGAQPSLPRAAETAEFLQAHAPGSFK